MQDDTLWSDSCTIADAIQDVVDALGWRWAGLVSHTLDIPDSHDDAEMAVAAQVLADGCEARLIVYLSDRIEFLAPMHLDEFSTVVSISTAQEHSKIPLAA